MKFGLYTRLAFSGGLPNTGSAAATRSLCSPCANHRLRRSPPMN